MLKDIIKRKPKTFWGRAAWFVVLYILGVSFVAGAAYGLKALAGI